MRKMSAGTRINNEHVRGRTRLAPSPTGALHLGNARTFLMNWAMARQRGLEVVLRIEDLDTPRVRAGAIEETIDILAWLGMDWDIGPMVQSEDLEPYRSAMRVLAESGAAYPCDLTRGEIKASASAPQEGSGEMRFPSSLRPEVRGRAFEREDSNWRMVTRSGAVRFEDGFRGAVEVCPEEEVGDFVVWTRRGLPSYQLAVVVDDARQGVTEIVRGDDLLGSAGRQALLYEALGVGEMPTQVHVPLVRGEDGRRLAKRHGDTRLSSYREAGVCVERVIGLIGYWCGMSARREEMSVGAFRLGFRLDRIGKQDVVFTEEDEQWLKGIT